MARVGRHSKEKSRPCPTPGLGRRIRALRQDRHLSQEALAEKADLSTTYVSELERGRRDPSLSTLTALAAGLQVDLVDLVAEGKLVEEDVEALRSAVKLKIEEMDEGQVRRLQVFIDQVFR